MVIGGSPAVVGVVEGSDEILRRLRDRASRALGEPVSRAVITVPAFFDENQRQATREAAAEITFAMRPFVDTDIAVPLDRAADFLTAIHARLGTVDQAHEPLTVAHLGDGNLHFTVCPVGGSKATYDRVVTMIEDVVADLGGSFSAEHGVGLSKLNSMDRRKDPVALDVMRAIKSALDPQNLLNPGKVIPAAKA